METLTIPFILYLAFMINSEMVLKKKVSNKVMHYLLFILCFFIDIMIIYVLGKYSIHVYSESLEFNGFFKVFIIYCITNLILYKNNLRQTLFISFKTYMLYTLAAKLSYWLTFYTLKRVHPKLDSIKMGNFNYAIVLVIIIILSMIICTVIDYYFYRYNQIIEYIYKLLQSNKNMILMYLSAMAYYLFITLSLSKINYYLDDSSMVSILEIYLFGLFALNFLVLYLLKMGLELEERQQKLQTYIDIKEKTYIDVVNSSLSIRKISHDIKNHNNILTTLLKENKVNEAIEYLESIKDAVNNTEDFRVCNNLIINVILKTKINKIKENNIKFITDFKIPRELNISDFDISTLFVNLLDNAIEACEKVDIDKRFIDVKVKMLENRLIIEIENSSNIKENKIFETLITTKLDANNHGLGTKNIEEIVKKYNGNIVYKNTNFKFKTTLYLIL